MLLIDEIDRADAEFEAFLLEVLSDFQISVPELGTLKAKHMPLVVLTSNNTRELSEALKRRCLYLFLDYPNLETELSIVRLKVPDLAPQTARQAVELVHRLRELDLKKHPSVSETLDWAQALVTLNAEPYRPGHAGQHPDRAAEARARRAACAAGPERRRTSGREPRQRSIERRRSAFQASRGVRRSRISRRI